MLFTNETHQNKPLLNKKTKKNTENQQISNK